MKRIFKYNLYPGGAGQVWMPSGAKLLAVQKQYGTLVIWAEVEENAPPVWRNFHVYVTGATMAEPRPDETYVGTVQFEDGTTILHVYDRGE